MTLTVVRPGLLSTVQDLGRPGWGALGVPPGGAMDPLALRLGNLLVANAVVLAGIEFTLSGPEVRFESDLWVALTGSRFESRVGERLAPHAEPFFVHRGEVLRLGRTLEGARAYLAVMGGVDVPAVLGSRSTCLAGGFGGLAGRPLRAGDRLPVGAAPLDGRPGRLRREAPAAYPPYEEEVVLRAVAGPQEEAFTESGRRGFWSSTYRVSTRSNRMGLRLEGPPIEHARPADLLPEGLAPGAIQVPADGAPILLGVDRPTTGGYTKIATVITADLVRAAQAKPGDRVRFAAVGVEEARSLHKRQEELLGSAVEEAG
jgi:antagonist of KipI